MIRLRDASAIIFGTPGIAFDHDSDGYVRGISAEPMDGVVQRAVEGHVQFARKGESRWTSPR